EEGLSQAELFEVSTKRTIDAVTAAGSQAVIIDPFPIDPDTSRGKGGRVTCLSEGEPPSACDFVVDTRPVPATERYAEIDVSTANVHVLDLDRVVCPKLPSCPSVVDGLITHRDRNHPTTTFMLHQAPLVYR